MLWSVTEIRDGCGTLEYLPRPHLLPGPLLRATPGSRWGCNHSGRSEQDPPSSASLLGEAKGELELCQALLLLSYLGWSTASDISSQGSSLSAVTQPGRAYWLMPKVISLPQTNTPAPTTLSVQWALRLGSQVAVGRQLKYHKPYWSEVKVSGLTAVTPAVGNGFAEPGFFTPQGAVSCSGTDCAMQSTTGAMQNTRARDDRPFLLISLYPKSV